MTDNSNTVAKGGFDGVRGLPFPAFPCLAPVGAASSAVPHHAAPCRNGQHGRGRQRAADHGQLVAGVLLAACWLGCWTSANPVLFISSCEDGVHGVHGVHYLANFVHGGLVGSLARWLA
ncbi:hypothetical protein F4777DRAFT_544703 [Nemania sp. FL0916]|nr:hypothetical protein F4777DRAFT_544703 [Nemania sp. FL0916]